jgi:hypothetical protein
MAKKAIQKIGTRGKGSTVKDDDGFEVLGGGNSNGLEIGEMVEGVYGGVVRTMPGKKRGSDPIPFYQVGTRVLLGGTVLKKRIEEGKVKPGDMLRVTRLEDAPAKRGQNAAKLFDVRVKRK